MKTLLPIIFGGFIFMLSGCKEVRPDLNFGPPTGLGDRVVLIEEFTGAQCTFCPLGTEELSNLLTLYPDNLAVVGLHVGFFSTPHPTYSKYDFRSPEGNALENFLQKPSLWPSAIINRNQFPGEIGLQLGKQQWPTYIEQEVARDPIIGLSITRDYDASTRLLKVNVVGVARQNIDAALRVNVVLTESGIIDYQKDSRFGDVLDYNHKHVLRKMLNTNFEGGDPLAMNGLEQGATVGYNVEYTLPEEWNPANCELIAFVTDGDTRYVYQAAKTKLIK
jgi:hypothetical protein